MKKILYKTALLTILSLSIVSCKKFLEKQPIGQVAKGTLFEDVNGAKLALNGSYNTMLAYYKTEFGMYADVASDNMISKSSATVTMLPQFNFQSTSGDDALAVGHIWLDIFEALNNINNLINAIPALEVSFPAQLQDLEFIKAQALVLRALCEFDLSRVYAQPYNYTADASHLGVPVLLKTPSPGIGVGRSTMKETYDQILADMNAALPVLKQDYDKNRGTNVKQAVVNYAAAAGLLSRIYLYNGNWAQSVANANLAIASNTAFVLATATNYPTVFNTYPVVPDPASPTPNVEDLFQLTNFGVTVYGVKDINNVFSDTQAAEYAASAKILNLFDVGDIRKTMFSTAVGLNYTKKYVGGKSPLLIHVIRLSEAYLNRAEAQWNLGKYTEAADDIRIISQRAHPTQTINITYTSPADLYKQIADERNRELCFEGHRLFDIVRRKESLQRGGDCNSTTCSLTYPNNKFVLPITTKELEANKSMQQNPGY